MNRRSFDRQGMFQPSVMHVDDGVRAQHVDFQCALVLTPTRRHIVTRRTRTVHFIMRLITRARRLVVPPLACALTAAGSCSAPLASSTPSANTPAASGTSPVAERDVRRLLAALSDDSLEGRMTATRGSARAAAIIATEMRRIGLAPAGDSGYFQRVPIGLRVGGRRAEPVLFDSFDAPG